MVRHILSTGRWQVQCPTCRRMVDANKAVFDGLEPLQRHTRWAPSWVQLAAVRWPVIQRRRLLLRTLIRLEWLARWLTRQYEPECLDRTPRHYRDLLPQGLAAGPIA